MYFGEPILEQDQQAPKRQSGGIWIAILAIAICVPPLLVAWHYGAPLGREFKFFVAPFRSLLRDVADTLGDFWQYILSHRQ